MSTALRLAGAVLLACTALAACGESGATEPRAVKQADHVEPNRVADGSAPTKPGPTEPEPTAEAPTVIVAGDSMIYDVSPAVVEALSPHAATVVPMVTPSLAQEASRASLLGRIEELAPDVVVVMVGIWERGHVTTSGFELGDEGFYDEYTREALDPVTDRLAAADGRLLLLGPPHIRVASDDEQLSQLEQVWEDYARTHSQVDFIDADTWLIESDRFVEVTDVAGTATRLRRVDGIHMCEEGARRVAIGLVNHLAEVLAPVAVEPEDGWETGPWTARFPADECPPLS